MGKQETLEEAAEKYDDYYSADGDTFLEDAFIAGAKWQAERMYSEERVRRIASRAWLMHPNPENMIEEFDIWFEKLKKII